MGERKVLNKYYPPDFDPAKIPRRKQPKNQQIKVRMMLPMSIRCNTCGNYIYKGTKFNSRKEDCENETYLGIQIFRFYFKCSRCSAELTMKTDPQNSDYIMESGASRNYEPWRATDEATDEAKKERDAEELGDAMKALENRTIDSKQEMDILAALDEMKSMRSRHATVGVEDMMAALRRTADKKEKELAEKDEAILRSVVFQGSKNFLRRLDDDDLEEDEEDFEDFNGDIPKRKKTEAGLQASNRESGRGIAHAADVIVDHVSKNETECNISTKPAGPSLAVRPKPVAFAIKPKVSGSAKWTIKVAGTQGLAQAETKKLEEDVVPTVQQSNAVASLGLAYAVSDESD